MLGPWAPLPAAGTNSAMSAVRWRRLPLTITRVWSGARPRSDVGRTNVSPSPDAIVALKDGTWKRRLSVMSPVLAACRNCSPEITSMGTVASAAELPGRRVPITRSSSTTSDSAASVRSEASAASVRSEASDCAVRSEASDCACAGTARPNAPRQWRLPRSTACVLQGHPRFDGLSWLSLSAVHGSPGLGESRLCKPR